MATGQTLSKWTAKSNEPPLVNYATLDTRNGHFVLDFDATTNESAVFSDVMSQNYSGATGVTVLLHISSDSTSGDTDWDVAFELIGDQQLDVDADDFAAVNSVDGTTVPATSGLVDIVTITFTDGADMDSVSAGDGYRIKVTRDAASDTSTGDAQIHFVEVRET